MSDAEVRRSARLFKDGANVSEKALQAARSQRASDAAHVSAIETQLRSTWGDWLRGESARFLSQLESDLLAGRASLVRATCLRRFQRG